MNGDAVLRNVSDTALVTAAIRARETQHQHALFRDPYAGMLAGERGQRLARRMRHRLVSSGVIARTAVLDEFILQTVDRDRPGLVLNLGAGLDTRPYRLPLPTDLRWVEADLPGIIDYKAKLLVEKWPHCQLERRGLDLTDTTARRALLHRLLPSQPTLVVCEGLVPYLDLEDARGLASDLAHWVDIRWWALDMVSSMFPRWANRVGGRRLASAGATFRFAPREGADFFRRDGWEPVQVRSSWLEQRRLGCEPWLMRAAWAVSPPPLRDAYRKLGLFVLLRRE